MPFSPRRGGSIRVPNRRGNKYFARRYRRRSPPLRFEETMMRRSRAIGPQKVRGPLSTSSLRDNLVVCLQDSKREKREKCFTIGPDQNRKALTSFQKRDSILQTRISHLARGRVFYFPILPSPLVNPFSPLLFFFFSHFRFRFGIETRLVI